MTTPASWDEQHRVVCADGRSISLYRYVSDTVESRGLPVLLCPGLGATFRNMDLEEGRSIARFLADAGRDVWVIALRGTDSVPWATQRDRSQWIEFEDFVQYDVPAAIDTILTQTRASRVHWVGHSMGGLIGVTCAQGEHRDTFASLTAIAAPAALELPSWLVSLAAYERVFLGWYPRLPLRWFAALFAPFVLVHPFHTVAGRKASTSPSVSRRALVTILSDIPTSLMAQFARWAHRGQWPSVRLGRPIASGYASIDIPLCAIAGQHDPVAPPHIARRLVDQASSQHTLFLNIGTDGKASEMAYTHNDLMVGEWAQRDVFPHVVSWLDDVEDALSSQIPRLLPALDVEVRTPKILADMDAPDVSVQSVGAVWDVPVCRDQSDSAQGAVWEREDIEMCAASCSTSAAQDCSASHGAEDCARSSRSVAQNALDAEVGDLPQGAAPPHIDSMDEDHAEDEETDGANEPLQEDRDPALLRSDDVSPKLQAAVSSSRWDARSSRSQRPDLRPVRLNRAPVSGDPFFEALKEAAIHMDTDTPTDQDTPTSTTHGPNRDESR